MRRSACAAGITALKQDDATSLRLLDVIVKAAQAMGTDEQEFVSLLGLASGLLWSLKPDEPALPLTTLKRCISLPLEHWLDERLRQGFVGSLRFAGAPSLLCDEMALELDEKRGWERVQSVVLQIRNLCRTRERGEEEYRIFRMFLIEHGVVESNQVLEFLIPLGVGFSTLYEPIPAHDQRAGMIYLCPTCHWPMTLNRSEVRCGSNWCLETGGVYQWRDDALLSTKTSAAVEGQPANNKYRLRTGLWKFTLIPGLLELRLLHRISQLGLQTELWPDVDRADLRVTWEGSEWEVDAKVWASPMLLDWHLRSLSGTPRWIVIPDYQRSFVHSLNENCPSNLQVMTEAQCLRKVLQACRC